MIGLFIFSIFPGSVLEGCAFLRNCPFLPGYPFYWLDSLPASCGTLSPFKLFSRSQPQSLPWDLTSEAQASAPSPHPPWLVSDKPLRLMNAGWHWSFVRECLWFALCTPVAALSFVAPKLPPWPPHRLHQWRGFLVCGKFSSFTAQFQRCRSHPYSFVSVFLISFALPWYVGSFLPFGKSEVFCQHSVGVL